MPLSRSVNITSLSVPDARLDLDSANGPPLPDPRVILTTYDLQWPNETATLNETAIRLHERFSASSLTPGNSSTYDPICMNVVADPIWPNVTNKLNDSNDGDCEAILGQECVAALLSEPLNGGRCGNPNINTPACQGVFNNGFQEVIGSGESTTIDKRDPHHPSEKTPPPPKLTLSEKKKQRSPQASAKRVATPPL
jgi:hypothetical protein